MKDYTEIINESGNASSADLEQMYLEVVKSNIWYSTTLTGYQNALTEYAEDVTRLANKNVAQAMKIRRLQAQVKRLKKQLQDK